MRKNRLFLSDLHSGWRHIYISGTPNLLMKQITSYHFPLPRALGLSLRSHILSLVDSTVLAV